MDPAALATLATTAVAALSPYLVKAGTKAVEEVGKQLPGAISNLWQTITAKFKGKPAAEEAVKDLVAQPEDEDNQASFRKELRKLLADDTAFAEELQRLLDRVQQQEAGDTIMNTGSGAVAKGGSVAAGEGGVAVQGDVQGGINVGRSGKQD